MPFLAIDQGSGLTRVWRGLCEQLGGGVQCCHYQVVTCGGMCGGGAGGVPLGLASSKSGLAWLRMLLALGVDSTSLQRAEISNDDRASSVLGCTCSRSPFCSDAGMPGPHLPDDLPNRTAAGFVESPGDH